MVDVMWIERLKSYYLVIGKEQALNVMMMFDHSEEDIFLQDERSSIGFLRVSAQMSSSAGGGGL